MDVNKVARLAVDAGKLILENGGETYRVEETIIRILMAFGFKDADSFVTPTGIMVSVSDETGNTVSIIKRVRVRTVDLEKIIRVNDISRNILIRGYSAEEVHRQLSEIKGLHRYNQTVTILFSALAAGCFSLLFGGSKTDFAAAFLIGGFIKLATSALSKLNINDFFINISGGAIAASLAILASALGLSNNIDKIIIGSIMLLVPGLSITNAIRDTIAGDLMAGMTRALEAFLIAIGVAMGTGIVLKLWISLSGRLGL